MFKNCDSEFVCFTFYSLLLLFFNVSETLKHYSEYLKISCQADDVNTWYPLRPPKKISTCFPLPQIKKKQSIKWEFRNAYFFILFYFIFNCGKISFTDRSALNLLTTNKAERTDDHKLLTRILSELDTTFGLAMAQLKGLQKWCAPI